MTAFTLDEAPSRTALVAATGAVLVDSIGTPERAHEERAARKTKTSVASPTGDCTLPPLAGTGRIKCSSQFGKQGV
jgi:hypothetical protein